MPPRKQKKSNPKPQDTVVTEIQKGKISPLKWMAIFPKDTPKCAKRRPRYARIIDLHYIRHKKGVRALNRVKSVRLLSLRLISYEVIPKYKGELTQLLLKTHYLKKFHFQFHLARNKDFQTVRKLVLRQKNLQHLALLSNWGKLSKFPKIKNPQVQIRMIHKVGKYLRKLILGNITSETGPYFRPEYLSNLQFCVFSTTCNDTYGAFPKYTGKVHGELARKLLSIPSLRKFNIRSCDNFIDINFWKACGEGLIKREEPIYMDIGCGVWGYGDENYQNEKKYERNLKQAMYVLKPGQVFNYSSSWHVFRLKGVPKTKAKPKRGQKAPNGIEDINDPPDDEDDKDYRDDAEDEDLHLYERGNDRDEDEVEQEEDEEDDKEGEGEGEDEDDDEDEGGGGGGIKWRR